MLLQFLPGSVWELVGDERWSSVCAEALYGAHGGVACITPTGELMIMNPDTAVALVQYIIGSSILCLTIKIHCLGERRLRG